MRRNSGPWLAWALLVLALLLIALSESGAVSPLTSVLGTVISPIERGVSTFVDVLGSFGRSTRDIQTLQEQVEALETQNDALLQENFRLREYQAENRELRRQLNFAQENPTYDLVGADVVEQGCVVYPCGKVVGEDTNPYLSYIIIGVGSQSGVAVGMPVVTGGAAMVGRVVRTSPSLSYVQLINDPESQLSAMLQQSRVTGIVEGSMDGEIFMTDILPDESVNVGETVVTSSLGGMLPRGLILGQVEEVEYQESDLFQRAQIRPAVDFRRLETVLVVTEFPQPNLEELETP
jgi:rod shape-determining protein MreC